jgi:hypothetical protein
LAAAVFQAALPIDRNAARSRLKDGCRQDWPPYKRFSAPIEMTGTHYTSSKKELLPRRLIERTGRATEIPREVLFLCERQVLPAPLASLP